MYNQSRPEIQMASRLLHYRLAACEAFRFDGNDDTPPLNCVNVPPQITKRPDPAIYDQAFEVAHGRVPTWDNPDIVTHNAPPLVPLPTIQATVRNLSAEASAL